LLRAREVVEPNRSGHLVEEGGYVGKSVREVSETSVVVRRGRAGVLDLYRLLWVYAGGSARQRVAFSMSTVRVVHIQNMSGRRKWPREERQ
jgi:hypothetical protein